MKKYSLAITAGIMTVSITYGQSPKINTQRIQKEAPVSFEYSLNLEVPEFLPNSTYQNFNTRIDDIVEKNKQELFTQAASIAASPTRKNITRPLKNTLTSQYDTSSTPNTISTVIKFEGYTTPAAHPYHKIYTVNYDVNKKQVITLGQLFKSHADYLKAISQQSRDSLLAQKLEDSDILRSGTEPNLKNYRNWSITPDRNLRIDFEDYQVGAYISGEPKVIVKTNDLKPLLSEYGMSVFFPNAKGK